MMSNIITNLLSVIIYGWCVYTVIFKYSAYADYMGIPAEADNSSDQEDEDGKSDADSSEEGSEEVAGQ